MSDDDIDMRATIEPKSDQLNADDLLAGPITVTITAVKHGPSPEQPVDIYLEGHRPYRPCKSMRRVLVAAWDHIAANWVGKRMTLYCDPSVKFGGVALGGIRISHLSHIDKPLTLMLTTTRSKRAGYEVQPLAEARWSPGAASVISDMAVAASLEDLAVLAAQAKKFSEAADVSALRSAYSSAKKRISAQAASHE